MSIEQTLEERGKRYGDFAGHALVTQGLKDAMYGVAGWRRLSPSQKEALEMIVHKIGRILNGDPDYADSWHDIAGYAKLVEDELNDATYEQVVEVSNGVVLRGPVRHSSMRHTHEQGEA